MGRLPAELVLTLVVIAVILAMCWPGVPESVDRAIDSGMVPIDKALGLPTATPAYTSTGQTSMMVPGVTPAETVLGEHTLGGDCSVPYAWSDQDPDLICSVDCGMTWRSESHPGVCY